MDTPPQTSDQIDNIAQALSKAQGAIEEAERTGKNSFLGNTYADLTSVMASVRGPLAANGLAITQTYLPMDGQTHLVTTLLHESGQFLRGFMPLLGVKDHHSLGSAVTYARRFSLASILGVTPQGDMADDDAEAAMGRGQPAAKKKPARKPAAKKPAAKEDLETRGVAKAKCLIIIEQVKGAAQYLRNKDIDPGDPPPNIRDKILELGTDGFAQKIKDARAEEAKAIVDAAETVTPLKEESAA